MNNIKTGMAQTLEIIRRDCIRWRKEAAECSDYRQTGKAERMCGNCTNVEYGFICDNGLAISGCFFCMKYRKIVQYSGQVPRDRVNNKYSVQVKEKNLR